MATAPGMASDCARAFDHVPGRKSVAARIGADHEDRRVAARRRAPLRKADHQRHRRGHAVDRQRAKPLAFVEQRRILETLGSTRHDPEVGVGVVDHDRDHPLEAHIEAHLHGHQHDREHDADDGRDQPQPIMKQVPEREFGGERHDWLRVDRSVTTTTRYRRFCKRARFGADQPGAERNVAQGRDQLPS